MELKHASIALATSSGFILIVPYGIETLSE